MDAVTALANGYVFQFLILGYLNTWLSRTKIGVNLSIPHFRIHVTKILRNGDDIPTFNSSF